MIYFRRQQKTIFHRKSKSVISTSFKIVPPEYRFNRGDFVGKYLFDTAAAALRTTNQTDKPLRHIRLFAQTAAARRLQFHKNVNEGKLKNRKSKILFVA